MQALHRIRERHITMRTALVHHMRARDGRLKTEVG
jgi:hypothetical protein